MIDYALEFARILSIFAPVVCFMVLVTEWRVYLPKWQRNVLFLVFEVFIFIFAFIVVPWEYSKITSYLEIMLLSLGSTLP